MGDELGGVGRGIPVVAYAIDMAVVAATWGLGWSPEMVAGTPILAALFVLGVSFMAFPTATRLEDASEVMSVERDRRTPGARSRSVWTRREAP